MSAGRGQCDNGCKLAAGFSLVEVVSSLGIVSFGLMALLGLLPVGLKAARSARESTAETQIVQYLSALARQTPRAELASLAAPREFSFDRQGVAISEGDLDIFYTATLTVETAGGTVLPAAENYTSASLATFRIHLKKRSGGEERIVSLHRVLVGP